MDSVAGLANGGNFEGVIRIEEEKIRSHVGEVAARLRHRIAGTRWGKRVYLDMDRLREESQTESAMTIA